MKEENEVAIVQAFADDNNAHTDKGEQTWLAKKIAEIRAESNLPKSSVWEKAPILTGVKKSELQIHTLWKLNHHQLCQQDSNARSGLRVRENS